MRAHTVRAVRCPFEGDPAASLIVSQPHTTSTRQTPVAYHLIWAALRLVYFAFLFLGVPGGKKYMENQDIC